MTTVPAANKPSATVQERIMTALAQVHDPCMAAAGMPTSIVDLGLIDGVDIDGSRIRIDILFTEVGCPFAHRVMDGIIAAVQSVAPGWAVTVRPNWREQWTEARMAPAARAALHAARRPLSRNVRSMKPEPK
jgi:metal-sulfur cluster biosynthetic enzyme